ncbi:hypothetical protein H2203_006688 [Taxawa tesnikishii (nom. ined.)]|nr:hypothetical protein H2203_006688 [Dothideales sp. JES 119]
MSTPRLTFLYPFLFASTKPSVSRSASRTVTRGFRATCGAHQHNTVNQRYGTANEPPPHLGGGQAIPMGAPKAVLHMPSSESQAQATAPVYSDEEGHAHASLNGSDAQKPPHISTPPYVHHFDTYGLVRRLEEGGWTQPQAVTIMKAVRLILASNMELAREGLVSRSNVENETYLFRAACSELRTELTTKRKAESERQRSERTQLQHEVDILGQRLTQEGGNLKDELKGMFDDRKMGVRNEQRDMDRKIQELNYRITVSLNSDSRSEVEGLRWVITKRAITALAVCVTMILSSLKFSSSMMHIQEEERKNMAAMDKEGKGKGREERKEKEEQVIGAGEMLVQQGDNPAFVSLG